jgi:hypothetical protein
MTEYQRTEISPLLEDIVKDNPTYPFPVMTIREELVQLFINQDEFEYFMMQAFRKLKSEHHIIFANVFLTTLEQVLDTLGVDPHNLPNELYQQKIDHFISILEVLRITRVEKNSPDGELLSAMV